MRPLHQPRHHFHPRADFLRVHRAPVLPELNGAHFPERRKAVRAGLVAGGSRVGQGVDGRAFLHGDQVVQIVAGTGKGNAHGQAVERVVVVDALVRVDGLDLMFEGVERLSEVREGAVGEAGGLVADVDVQACGEVSADGPWLIGREDGEDVPDLVQAFSQALSGAAGEDAGGDLDALMVGGW